MAELQRLLLVVTFLLHFLSFGQTQFKGNVTDAERGTPVEFCSIAILSKTDSSTLGGVLTDSLGYFELQIDAPSILRLSAIGYQTKYLLSSELVSDGLLSIQLESSVQNLDDVVVRGEVSEMIFKLDKRVFNVGKDLSNSGGSALEVLNNVPSVEVSLEGLVKLRGNSNVQILINGKPSVVASDAGSGLGAISAEMIDKIEVITNPSAKYDASGTTGIINIILKKDSKKGVNGSVTVNTGFPNNHSLGASINYRSKKVNVFSQVGIGLRTFVSEREGFNNDLKIGNKLNWTGDDEKNERFINARLGADFYLNRYNTITVSGDFAYEWESEFATWNYELDKTGTYHRFDRNETTHATNPKWQFDVSHELMFKKNKDQKLSTSATGRYFGKAKKSEFLNSLLQGTDVTPDQRSESDFFSASYTARTDYTLPIKKTMTLEIGAKYDLDLSNNQLDVYNKNNQVWSADTNFSNDINFQINVIGAYTTFAWEKEAFGVKAGIRYEHTLSEIKSANIEKKTWNYFNFFPSIHTSYKASKKVSFQLGYSRRIERPNMWDLNPFVSFRDNYNLSTGNPSLQPEFSHAIEFTSIFNWKKSNLNTSLYYTHTDGVIEDIYIINDNVSTRTVDNIGTSQIGGIELNHKYRPAKWFSVLTDLNFSYFSRNGQYKDQNFDFSNYRGSLRVTTKFKFKKGFEAQVSGRYLTPVQNVFFDEEQIYYCDLGLRQKVLKGRGVINLSVRDVFNSRAHISSSERTDFSFYSSRKRGRYIVLGFSYGFGKGETMEYGGFKRF